MAFFRHFLCRVLWCVVLVTSSREASPGPHDAVVDAEAAAREGEEHNVTANDHHGGIPMGNVPNCDDSKTNIEVDWEPHSTRESTCRGHILKPNRTKVICKCEQNTSEPIHVCLPTPISYVETPPTSGKHRLGWPVYGEYVYVPPQRWLHSLEHGAVVMLYHPCADPEAVEELKDLVKNCLRRHIITPYPGLAEDTPLALLTWGCRLLMSHVLPNLTHTFIMTHANRGPEGNVAANGQYSAGLLNKSHTVSDYHDTQLCPHFRPSPGHAQCLRVPQNLSEPTSSIDDKGRTSSPAPVNPIFVQSKRRRQRLVKMSGTAQRHIDKLNTAFRKLVSVVQ